MRKIFFTISVLIIILFSGKSAVAQKEKSYPTEKIYLHLQKSIFIAGEDVNFKAYCLDLSNNKLSKLSNIAYIELVNKNGFPVAKQSIIIENGAGHGGVITNELLPSGYYSINAYTHWGNNIGKDLISVYPIYIYNNNANGQKPEIFTNNSQINIIKTNDWVNSTSIGNDSNDEVNVKTKLIDLERILAINIEHHDTNIIASELHHIKLSSQTDIEWKKEFRFVNGKWDTNIKLSELKSPIYYLNITNHEGNSIYQNTLYLDKIWYKQVIEKPRLKVKSRQKNKIILQLSDLSYKSDSLFVSASIIKKEPIPIAKNIITFQNFYKNFNYQSNETNDNLDQITNNKWLGNKKLLPIWLNVNSTYPQSDSRYIEKDNYILEGQAVNKETNSPHSNSEVFLSKIGEFADIQPFLTKENGKFYFHLPLKSGLHDISLQVIDNDSIDIRFDLKSKYNKTGLFYPLKALNLSSEKNKEFIKNQWENYKIRNIYKQLDLNNQSDSILYRAESNFFNDPKLKISIDDYVRLDSLDEYFHELISHVKIKYRKKQALMNVYNYDQHRLMNQKPLFLYDGLIISNPTEILAKSPNEIERIEVVPYEYFYKSSHFYGIVHVISRNKTCEVSSLPNNTERYYLPLFISEIQKSGYQKPEKHQPDFRTDLLWEPNLTLTKNNEIKLEFISSDVKGEYELVLEGISEKGEPIVLKQSILIE